MGGGSNTQREFLIKGDQVFDAQDENTPLGRVRNYQGGSTPSGSYGGGSAVNTGSSSSGNSNPSSSR